MKKSETSYLNGTFSQLAEFEATQEISTKTARDGLTIFKNALDSSISGHIITDLAGIIYYANPSFCKLFDIPQIPHYPGLSCNGLTGFCSKVHLLF